MVLERSHGANRHSRGPASALFRKLFEKARDEERNVPTTLAKRRDFQADDIQPVIEILAETSLPDKCIEVAIRRRYDPSGSGEGLRAPDPLVLPLLQDAEQLDLHFEAEIADLVEKNGPVFGKVNAPGFAVCRACKAPALVAEKFAFQEGFGQRPADNLHEGLERPRGTCMKEVRKESFPRARLPLE